MSRRNEELLCSLTHAAGNICARSLPAGLPVARGTGWPRVFIDSELPPLAGDPWNYPMKDGIRVEEGTAEENEDKGAENG